MLHSGGRDWLYGCARCRLLRLYSHIHGGRLTLICVSFCFKYLARAWSSLSGDAINRLFLGCRSTAHAKSGDAAHRARNHQWIGRTRRRRRRFWCSRRCRWACYWRQDYLERRAGKAFFIVRVFRSPLAAVLPLALVAPQIVWTKTGNNRERLELSRKLLRQSPQQLLSMLAL